MLADATHISFPGGAKFAIGLTGLMHTAVAALAIGFAAIVTVMQIVGYRKKDRAYDLIDAFLSPDTGEFWVMEYGMGHGNAKTYARISDEDMLKRGLKFLRKPAMGDNHHSDHRMFPRKGLHGPLRRLSEATVTLTLSPS